MYDYMMDVSPYLGPSGCECDEPAALLNREGIRAGYRYILVHSCSYRFRFRYVLHPWTAKYSHWMLQPDCARSLAIRLSRKCPSGHHTNRTEQNRTERTHKYECSQE
jgi:hypothetical protein